MVLCQLDEKNTIPLGLKVRQGAEHCHLFVEKGSISSILAFFRQNRNYGYNAQIKKTKITLSYIIPIRNLYQYEPNRRTLKDQLDIPRHNTTKTTSVSYLQQITSAYVFLLLFCSIDNSQIQFTKRNFF